MSQIKWCKNDRIRKMGRVVSIWILILTFNADTIFAQSGVPEYQIKAIFLYNFAQFIEWPSNSFATADSPFVIGIVGKDPFGKYLDETIKDEKVNGHPMVIRRFNDLSAIDDNGIHILYVNLPKAELKTVFKPFESGTLTVGDNEIFTHEGGMIRFYTDNNKTKIEINLEVAKEADLVISSKLLRLAEIVGYPK